MRCCDKVAPGAAPPAAAATEAAADRQQALLSELADGLTDSSAAPTAATALRATSILAHSASLALSKDGRHRIARATAAASCGRVAGPELAIGVSAATTPLMEDTLSPAEPFPHAMTMDARSSVCVCKSSQSSRRSARSK
eukprot:scaffold147818_cov27-Tisochrysis_lutea.AAC.3